MSAILVIILSEGKRRFLSLNNGRQVECVLSAPFHGPAILFVRLYGFSGEGRRTLVSLVILFVVSSKFPFTVDVNRLIAICHRQQMEGHASSLQNSTEA